MKTPDKASPRTVAYHYVQAARRVDGADVAARVTGLPQLWLVWSLTADQDGTPSNTLNFEGPVIPGQDQFSGSVPLASYGMAIFDIKSNDTTTIPPATPVFARLSSTGESGATWLGDPMRFTTYPSTPDTTTRGFTVLSCQRAWDSPLEPSIGGTRLELVWHDVLTNSVASDTNPYPIEEILWDGDMGYWADSIRQSAPFDPPGKYAQQQWPSFDNMPTMRLALAQIPWRYHKDDHEVGPENPDPNDGLFNLNAAIKQIFVDAPEGDIRSRKGFLAQRFNLLPNVRVYHLDSYARERGPSTQRGDLFDPIHPHNPDKSKSFLGGPQDKWLFDDLTNDPPPGLVLFVCPKSFLGESIKGLPPKDNKENDKVRAYPGWREWFVSQCTGLGIVTRMAWIGGDRHATGYCPGAPYNKFGNFPVWLTSGVSMHPLKLQPGEDSITDPFSHGYTVSEGWKPDGWGNGYGPSVMQYVNFTIADNPAARQITLAGQSRRIDNNWDGKDKESKEWPNWQAEGVQPSGVSGSNIFAY